MLDTLGQELEPGQIVLFPKGAQYFSGVVTKIGNTIALAGVGKHDWYTGFAVTKSRKKDVQLITVNEAQLIGFETRYAQTLAGQAETITFTSLNREWRHGNPHGDRYVTEQITPEDYASRNYRRLIQISRTIKDIPLEEYELIAGEVAIETYLPRR